MRFARYVKGTIVAYAFDDRGTIGLRHSDGRGLLRTSEGIPRSVVARIDLADVIVILSCIAEDLDHAACRKHGVEVET